MRWFAAQGQTGQLTEGLLAGTKGALNDQSNLARMDDARKRRRV
jgi:hypothetical protein